MELRTLNQEIKACGRIFPKGTIVRIMRTDYMWSYSSRSMYYGQGGVCCITRYDK